MRQKLLVVFFSAFLVFGLAVCGMAGGSNEKVPTSGAWQRSGNVQKTASFNATVKNGDILITVPVRRDQFKPAAGSHRVDNPDWVVKADYLYYDSDVGKYINPPRSNFVLEEISKEPECKAPTASGVLDIPENLSQNGTWVRLLVWGKDKVTGAPLWIDQKSDYCRFNGQGEPRYECLLNLENGQCRPVPDDYPTI